MFWTIQIQKNILILIGIISLSYVLIFLLSPKDITDYTIADTEYWRETKNRLMLKTAYDYNKESIASFPKNLSDWKGFNFKYKDKVYEVLNADILLSRAYTKDRKNIIWIDIINSKTGESFHKQRICAEGGGWTIDSESIAEFKIADAPNPFTKFYANRLDVSKDDKKQIIIYWFMFKKFGAKDAVTMIRITSSVDNNDVEKTFSLIKEFVEGQLFNAMYEKAGEETITTAESILKGYGNKGLLAMIMAILIPLGITITGVMKKD